MGNGNETAFPSHGSTGEVLQEGLTKREYIAAMCMAGVLNNGSLCYADKAIAADIAVGYADALLAALTPAGSKP